MILNVTNKPNEIKMKYTELTLNKPNLTKQN